MRVTNRELFAWSFLMSTAHGAGLMLFPVLLGLPTAPVDSAVPGAASPWIGATFIEAAAAAMLHTVALLAVMGSVAALVYARLGLGMLRRAWINLDLLWAVGLVTAGAVTLFT
jgi:hypothetical protein